jgi:hypothetical protein
MNFNTNFQGGLNNKIIAPIQMVPNQQRQIHSSNNVRPEIRNVDVVIDRLSKKLPWGEPIWFLFHTLAHKVKEKSFHLIKDELLNIIFLICNNLPCPDCANHATRYLQGVNFDTIATKEQLKEMLFNFHNSVNMRKGLPIFPREQLDERYNTAITVNIINNFYYNFDKSSHNQKMAANGFHRTRTIQRMKTWIAKHIYYFDP